MRQSYETIRETTLATRPQSESILAVVVGANLGYIVLVGGYSLTMWGKDTTTSETFLIPTAAAVYLFCAIPTYLPVGGICRFLIYRFTQRKAMESRARFIISLAVLLRSQFIWWVLWAQHSSSLHHRAQSLNLAWTQIIVLLHRYISPRTAASAPTDIPIKRSIWRQKSSCLYAHAN